METETQTYAPPPPRLAPPVAPITSGKRVRITITGHAHQLAHRPELLRVDTGGVSLMLDTSTAGVTVEDDPDGMAWTDGDVVQHSREHWTLTRTAGRWRSSLPHGTPWEDADVSVSLQDTGNGWGHLEVLRSQAIERMREALG